MARAPDRDADGRRMTSQDSRRSKVICWAVALLVGAADLAVFFWMDGPARLAGDNGSGRYWARQR